MDQTAAYTAGLIAATLMGGGYYINKAKSGGIGARAMMITLLMSFVLRLVLARAFTFFARMQYLLPTQGWAGLLDLHPEGLSYMGAIVGLLLGGYLGELMFHLPRHSLLDPMTSGMLLTLLLGRLSEGFISSGQGAYVDQAALQFFPLAVKNEWGEWYYAVFMLEALFALLILWDVHRRELYLGERWQRAMLLLFLSQMLCESLRAETIRWGFVRVYQLFCALGASVLVIAWAIKGRQRGLSPRVWLTPLPVLAGTLMATAGLEFALDRWQDTPRWSLYLVMAVLLAGLSALSVHLLHEEKSRVNVRGRVG